MEFIETSIFSSQIQELLDDESYREFQKQLVYRPDAGAVIPGAGGLRKVRWSVRGRGKRGGIRVIYYHIHSDGQILLLYAYAKNVTENLTKTQLQKLSALVRKELI
jgi:mRNA-degrading endonuclease RelE of RelBE toxin-antitoxin system